MTKTTKPLTGRMVLYIIIGFFGTYMTANFTLAYMAVKTFPGLEVKNTYDASQTFDRDRIAQEALGWSIDLGYDGAALQLKITGIDGTPVEVAEMQTTIGRSTTARADQQVFFKFSEGSYSAPVTLDGGNWQLILKARAKDGTRFRQHIVLNLRK